LYTASALDDSYSLERNLTNHDVVQLKNTTPFFILRRQISLLGT